MQARGIAGITLRPLAAELSVAPRTLLYHFGSKENLLIEAIRHLRHQQPAIDHALGIGPRPGEDTAGMLAETIKRMWHESKREQSRPFLALYFELAALTIRDPDQYSPMLHELDQDWTAAITAHLRHSGMSNEAADSLTESLLIGYRGALHFGLVTGRWNAAEDAVDDMLDDTLRTMNNGTE